MKSLEIATFSNEKGFLLSKEHFGRNWSFGNVHLMMHCSSKETLVLDSLSVSFVLHPQNFCVKGNPNKGSVDNHRYLPFQSHLSQMLRWAERYTKQLIGTSSALIFFFLEIRLTRGQSQWMHWRRCCSISLKWPFDNFSYKRRSSLVECVDVLRKKLVGKENSKIVRGRGLAYANKRNNFSRCWRFYFRPFKTIFDAQLMVPRPRMFNLCNEMEMRKKLVFWIKFRCLAN